MGRIGDVFVERAMTEQLIAGIKVWDMKVNVMESKTRHSTIRPEEEYWKFNISIKKAKEMLRVKTQKGIRHVVHLLHHRYRVDHMQLKSKRLNV